MTASLVLSPAPTTRVFESNLFGQLEVSETRIVAFPQGLLGFPDCERWIVLDGPAQGTSWLQSADYPGLAFLCIEPYMVYPEFTLDIPQAVVTGLNARHPDDLLVLALVTLANGGRRGTANLQGPVLINLHSRAGAQIVAADSAWGLQQPLPLQVLRWGR